MQWFQAIFCGFSPPASPQIPKFLMQRWSAVNVEDVHLATLRVYSPPENAPNQKTRIVLFLPPNRDPNDPNATPPPQQPNRPVFDPSSSTFYTSDGPEPDCYELDMVNESVENQIVVAERPKDPSLSVSTSAAAATPNTRARTTILTGRIKHECNLRPALTTTYRKQMKERHRKYNTPLRQIRYIEDAGVPGGRGGVNRLSSGVGGSSNAFGDLIVCHPFFYSFLNAYFFSRKRNPNKPRVPSNVWLVCPVTNFSTNYSRCSVRRRGGVYGLCVTRLSNQKSI